MHDAVRPLVSAAKIKELFAAAESSPAVIPVIPCTDTLKVLEEREDGALQVAAKNIDRSIVWGAQTPQVFHSEVLRRAYDSGFDTMFTDDASVVSKAGVPVLCMVGEKTNIKITTPEDLTLAAAILQIR